MFVKVDFVKDSQWHLVDEIDRYLGYVNDWEFADCLSRDEGVEIDDELFWEVDKSKLNSILHK